MFVHSHHSTMELGDPAALNQPLSKERASSQSEGSEDRHRGGKSPQFSRGNFNRLAGEVESRRTGSSEVAIPRSGRNAGARRQPRGMGLGLGLGIGLGVGRAATPNRSSASDARSALQRSLNAEGECFAMCVAGALDLPRLADSLERGLVGAAKRVVEPRTDLEIGHDGARLVERFGTGEDLVLQLQLFGGKQLFAFRFGCLVCWSFAKKELDETKELLREFMTRPLRVEDVDEDKMEFVVERGGVREDDDDLDDRGMEKDRKELQAIRQDQIVLTTDSPLERLAHSYALAQSVRLGVFEIVVGRSIEDTHEIPQTMAATGEVKLEQRDLGRQMGKLLSLRCDVNLHTDILDTPEIFWDEEQFEPHYVTCRGYLDVDKRVEILNQRLGVLKDLYDLLQNGMNVKNADKLEWIIIILILLEVVLEMLELFYDAWHH